MHIISCIDFCTFKKLFLHIKQQLPDYNTQRMKAFLLFAHKPKFVPNIFLFILFLLPIGLQANAKVSLNGKINYIPGTLEQVEKNLTPSFPSTLCCLPDNNLCNGESLLFHKTGIDEIESTKRSEVLFVDGSVGEIENILLNISPEINIVRINRESDGVLQITKVLKELHNLTAIHILSHGDVGLVKLGNSVLSESTLKKYASQLKIWGQSLTETGDILLYGCNVAKGNVGHQFVDQVSDITGADVAASADLTGAVKLGGNWELESQDGFVTTGLFADSRVLMSYQKVLDSATGVTNVAISADTGLSGDFITNTASQSITGTLVLNTNGNTAPVLYVSADGGSTRVLATIYGWVNGGGASGTFSANVTLVAGVSRSLTFYTGSSGGSALSGTQNYTLDTTNPSSLATKPVVLTPGSDSGTLLDNITNVNKPVLSVNLAGISGLSAGETVQIIDTNHSNLVVGSYTIIASDLTAGVWNRTTQNITSSTLALGVHNLVGNIIDIAGNTGLSSTTVLAINIVDEAAPLPNKASAGGNILTLSFTETGSGLKSTSVPSPSNFTFNQIGFSNSITAVSVNSATNEVTLTLLNPVSTSVNALLSYTPSGNANDLQDQAVPANKVVAFSGFYVSTSLPVYNVNFQPLLFNSSTSKFGSGTGKTAGDIILFNNIITINGQAMDAIVTTVATTNVTINNYDGVGSSFNVSSNFLEFDVTTSGISGGSAEFRIDFIKHGTYVNASRSGSGVILQNVVVNSWDIDTYPAGNYQFQEFGGFASYTVSTQSSLSQTNMGSNFVHFQNTDDVNNTFDITSATTGTPDADKYRVKATYFAISSFGIKTGNSSSGQAYFF